MSGSEIINKLLDYLGLNASQFADAIGLARPQAIYDIQKKKTVSVTSRMALRICSVYPEVSYSWLLTGEGPMLRDVINIPQKQNNDMEEQRLIDHLLNEIDYLRKKLDSQEEERKELRALYDKLVADNKALMSLTMGINEPINKSAI